MTPERRKYYAGIGEYEINLRGMLMEERRELKRHKQMLNGQITLQFDEKDNMFGTADKAILESIRFIKHLIKTYKKALPKHWPEGKLKPCPFCGSDEKSGLLRFDTVASVDLDESDYSEVYCGSSYLDVCYCVMCENCGARNDYFKHKSEAVEAWNKRYTND